MTPAYTDALEDIRGLHERTEMAAEVLWTLTDAIMADPCDWELSALFDPAGQGLADPPPGRASGQADT